MQLLAVLLASETPPFTGVCPVRPHPEDVELTTARWLSCLNTGVFKVVAPPPLLHEPVDRVVCVGCGVCVQDGAVDLLRELKSFNMTLKLLQVGV